MSCSRAALVALFLGSASLQAQAPAAPVMLYGDAMRHYVATGDARPAIAAMKNWTQPQFERAVEAYLVAGEGRAVERMAVLQLEIALGVVGQAPVMASACLQIGEKLVQRLNARPTNSPAGASDRVMFTANWYAGAASVFLQANDAGRAAPLIGRGLELAPNFPELRLMSALLIEVQALSAPAVGAASGQRASSERMKLLLLAHAAYERLLKDHPSFVRARVRLGRVLWMLNDAKRAEAELARARDQAQEPAQQYLAAMFLGRIYQERGDLALARVAYERALAAAPESQSAAAALGFLDVVTGRPDRAQERAHTVLSRKPAGDEWWAYKYGGYEWEAINWLRQAVRP